MAKKAANKKTNNTAFVIEDGDTPPEQEMEQSNEYHFIDVIAIIQDIQV